MKRNQYASLKEIRSEKERARRLIDYGVDKVKNDVVDCFVYPENFFLKSSNRYMNYVGYAISAYKTVMALGGTFGLFSKRRK